MKNKASGLINGRAHSITSEITPQNTEHSISFELTNSINALSENHLDSLNNTLTKVATALVAGGDHKDILRLARYRHIGVLKGIFNLLHELSHDEISAHISNASDNHVNLKANRLRN